MEEICFKCIKCDEEFEFEPDNFINEDSVHTGISPECPKCGSSHTVLDE